MGFRFRKSIKLGKNIKLNIGKKGINSVSIGGRGFTKNIGKNGTRTTVGIPETGVSYTNYKKYGNNKRQDKYRDKLNAPEKIAKNLANLELKYRDIPFEIQKIPFFGKAMKIELGFGMLFFILGFAVNIGFIVFAMPFLIIMAFSVLFSKSARANTAQYNAIKAYHFSDFNKCVKLCEKSLRLLENESTRKLMQEAQKYIDDGTEVKQITDEDIIKLRE
jgi:uncharacterized membrane protein